MANNIWVNEKLKVIKITGCVFLLLGISFISKASGPINVPVPVTDTVPPPNNTVTTSSPATTVTTATTATAATVSTTATGVEGTIKEVPKSKKQVKPIAVNTISVPASSIVKPKIIVKPIIKIH